MFDNGFDYDRQRDRWRKKNLTMSLKGKVKGESRERKCIFPCVIVASRVLDVGLWLRLLISGNKEAGSNRESAIVDWGGSMLDTSKLDTSFHSYLMHIYEDGCWFPVEIKTIEDILSIHQVIFGC